MKKHLRPAFIIITACAVSGALFFGIPRTAGGGAAFGAISLLPPAVCIALAVLTGEVLPSLFAGIWLAGTMTAGGNPVAGFGRGIEFIWEALGKPWSARILLTSLFTGGLVGIMRVGGGIDAAVEWVVRRVRSPRSALLATEFAGLIIFFEDYVNTLVVGTAMSPITAKFRISKEKLSYIVDSTAAPVTCIAGISTWIAFIVGQVGDAFTRLGIGYSPYMAYLLAIPAVFYSFTTLGLMTFMILSGRDAGPMLRAERRARAAGLISREGARPLMSAAGDELRPPEGCPRRIINFIVPLASLVGLVVALLLSSGGWPGVPLTDAMAAGKGSESLVTGAFGAVAITLLFYRAQNLAPTGLLFRGFVEGCRSMFFGVLILIFAWGIGTAIGSVGTANYLVGISTGTLPQAVIPMVTFLLGVVISFATGTTYGTIGILTPIMLPVLHGITGPGPGGMEIMCITIGAILSGAVFGDHCSPISDTTVMSSMFSGADHMDHVNSQIPYAFISALGALAGYGGIALGMPLYLAFPTALIATLAAFYLVSRPVEER
jgi:Na+/H+ antiporter NhaC